ncbi:hypothetical protein EYF80_022337 [Liparis tanakae]|uniref:Uncharacterized protein n=1 Tax=Liparis tanakae TaxID=230148 RepID=A0A4Z2HRH2_9TELE|nr:hypothetical protein EYF80_022337 [Liparis tanakae]
MTTGTRKMPTVIQVTYALAPHGSMKCAQQSDTLEPFLISLREKMKYCGVLSARLHIHRVADGDVAVQGHHHHHVGGREHAHHLEVLDDPAEEVGAVEAEGDLPAELRQHLEEGDHQVRQAEVFDEEVHPGHLLLGVVHRQQDAHVADHGHHEGDGQHHDLDLSHLLVTRVRVGCVRVRADVPGRFHRRVTRGTGEQRLVPFAQEHRIMFTGETSGTEHEDTLFIILNMRTYSHRPISTFFNHDDYFSFDILSWVRVSSCGLVTTSNLLVMKLNKGLEAKRERYSDNSSRKKVERLALADDSCALYEVSRGTES